MQYCRCKLDHVFCKIASFCLLDDFVYLKKFFRLNTDNPSNLNFDKISILKEMLEMDNDEKYIYQEHKRLL